MIQREKEFTDLMNQNRGIIYKVIRLYVNHPEDEQDLFQEINLQAWRSYERFNGLSKFSTWLYRVSLNTVLTFKRRAVLVKPAEDLEYLGGVHEPHTRTDESEVLYQAIRELSEIDRMIISLHLDGYENEEIADISGLTKNNVAVKLHRIKEAMTKKLKQY
ncbi:MAG: sigma-70 family RNA polymerase sigma factor [Cyclobacteriaceae bacterium]|jgi:RNA polymerase sigma-70 factor (ECF subfamily)|nr:sigma-70 family RNA polymerase sigma factor [Cyclobacteriaceae bacterium]